MAKESQVRPSRRETLTGLGAAGVGLAGATLLNSGVVHAVDEPGPVPNPGTPPLVKVSVQAAPVTPWTSNDIAGISLTSGTNTNVYTSSSGELTATAGGGFYTTNLVLPAGARITEIAAYFVKNIAAQDILIRLVRSDGSAATLKYFSGGTTAFGVSPNVQTFTDRSPRRRCRSPTLQLGALPHHQHARQRQHAACGVCASAMSHHRRTSCR